jgi:hypothetical protein
MSSWIKDGLTLLFTTIAIGSLLVLMAAAASAQVKTGWQIQVVKNNLRHNIGPPFPTKQLCEEVRFPVMIEMINDKVECLPVADHYNKD